MVWSRIKKMFDQGGVKLRYDFPKAFKWQDPVLPVAIELTNTTDEERVVVNLAFKIAEDSSNQRNGDKDDSWATEGQRRIFLTYEHPIDVRLAAGEATTVEVAIPLTAQGILDASGEADEQPAWARAAMAAMSAIDSMKRFDKSYMLSVCHTVEGYRPAPMRGRSIRHLRPGESAGSWSRHFG
jgi:hypothetical protein